MHIKIMTTPFLFAPEGEFGLFDINIELLKIIDYSQLSEWINYKPRFFNNIVGSPIFPGPPGHICSGWTWCMPGSGTHCLDPLLIINPVGPIIHPWGETSPTQQIYSWMIESIKMTQGTIEPSYNQTKYNATKQSYLSCLEDGTKKINFTKNTIKNNSVNGYCEQ
jgi:hypothetical protein